MVMLLLDSPPETNAPVIVDMAALVLLRSPIRGTDGQLRVLRCPLHPGQTVAACIPTVYQDARVLWNGGVLTAEAQAQTIVQPGDEVWILPPWGYVPGVYELLIY